VVNLFAKPHLLSEPMIAAVDESQCVACLLCKEVCPFTAIEAAEATDPLTRKPRPVARVNQGLCHGCGTCVAACRSASIRLRGWTDDQILLQLESLALARGEGGR
jgi:heterodisulfide reductase subunit A